MRTSRNQRQSAGQPGWKCGRDEELSPFPNGLSVDCRPLLCPGPEIFLP